VPPPADGRRGADSLASAARPRRWSVDEFDAPLASYPV